MTKPEVVTIQPSAALLAPVADPRHKIVTTGDIIDQLILTRKALATANAQLAAIRQWYDDNADVGK